MEMRDRKLRSGTGVLLETIRDAWVGDNAADTMALARTRLPCPRKDAKKSVFARPNAYPTSCAYLVARAIVLPRVIVPRYNGELRFEMVVSAVARLSLLRKMVANTAIGVIVERRETIGRIKISEVAADARPVEIS